MDENLIKRVVFSPNSPISERCRWIDKMQEQGKLLCVERDDDSEIANMVVRFDDPIDFLAFSVASGLVSMSRA